MPSHQILVRLPEDVAARFKAAVPPRQRNKFVADLVAKAVARQDDELARIAAAVTEEEQTNPKLGEEMRDWAVTTGDGMEDTAADEKP